MPNPYEEIFEEGSEKDKQAPSKESESSSADFEEDDRFVSEGKEPLDEILENNQLFQKKAETFSQLLSRSRAIDHKASNSVVRLFVVEKDPHDKGSLKGERKYHDLLKGKFESIIVPMKELAKLHLSIIQQFNREIDKDYFSVEKTDLNVKSDKSTAINGLNMQRKILAIAAKDLDILEDALQDTERRIKKYINAGGTNNISSAENEIIIQKRTTLTSGRSHQFDYSFFDINLLDKTVISLGIYLKETTAQYLGKLMQAFEA